MYTALIQLVLASSLVAQGNLPHSARRPPLLVNASRTERLDVAIRQYLYEFIGAVQRADTVALAALLPSDAVPAAEKPVGVRAGCPSVGRAAAALRAAREGESQNAALPLADVRLSEPVVRLDAQGDTVARANVRVQEYRRRKLRYAPVEFVFREVGNTWRIEVARGALVGLCGLAQPD